MSETRHAQLIAWLEDQGHTEQEIDKIVAWLNEYDNQTVRESIFDSIDSGKFDIGSVIKQALAEGDK